MATISLISSIVAPTEMGKANFVGEAVDAGEVVRMVAGVTMIADNVTQDGARVTGIALCDSLKAGQPVSYQEDGTLPVDAQLTEAGRVFVLATNGDIMDIDDLATGEYVSLVGWSTSATDLVISLMPTEYPYPL